MGAQTLSRIIKDTLSISERLEQIKGNIAAACQRSSRNPDDVKLIVVTKTAEFEQIKEVIEAGYTDLGENRIQHFKQVHEETAAFLKERESNPEITDSVNWHMIGHVQRNKVKPILKMASLIHSVDTLRLAEEIETTAGKMSVTADVLLQVNCSGEPQKYGVPVGAAIHLAEQIVSFNNIKLKGLMMMAPLTKDKDVVRACFIRAREIFEEIQSERYIDRDFTQLSMGMSQDYEIAVEEGATQLRIGSAIFA
jgi:hypothetical protein